MASKPRYVEQMKRDPRAPGSPIDAYLHDLHSMGQGGAEIVEQLVADLIETFSTESGLKTLILLEKSVLYAALPAGSPDGALRELNAQRNLVLAIRRLVANG